MNSVIEIFVITHNRSAELERTVSSIIKSPLEKVKITILNNASIDNTIDVSNKLIDKNNRICLITNKCNIGANANILRAIELSESKYTWIICDDDDYNFSKVEDVIEKVNEGLIELIHVGAHDTTWKHGGVEATAHELMETAYNYFKFGSFLTCNIFKTSLFKERYLIPGYNNIINSYPHMPFLHGIYNSKSKIYISKEKIITARVGNQSYDSSDWLIWWINNSLLLGNKYDVRKAFFDHFNGRLSTPTIQYIKEMRKTSEYHKKIIDQFIFRYFTWSEKFQYYF